MGRLVHIPNPLMPELGLRKFDVEQGLTVSEAIAREEMRLRYSTVLYRNGALVKRSEWDLVPLAQDETAMLVTLPQGGHGGGSNALQIIGTIALIAAAVFVPALLGFAAGSFAAAVTSAAILVGGQYLMSALLAKPKAFNPQGTASPTYSLNAQSNAARLGEPIPELFGQHIVYPNLAAQPYSDYSNDKETIHELFCLGIGEYDIHQIRVASTVAWQDGSFTGAYPEMEIEIVPPGGAVTLFPDNVATSTEVSAITLIGTNEGGYDWSGPFAASASGTQAAQLAVDIALPSGLFSIDSQGRLVNATVSFTFEKREIDAGGAPVGSWSTLFTQSFTMASRDAIRRTLVASVTPARYQVRGERTNAKAAGTSTADVLVWMSLRAFLPGARTYDDVTMIAVKATATDHLNGQSAQQFNVIATRVLPIYDTGTSSWGAPAATRSLAAAAAYLCRSDNGAGLADSRIDLARLFGALHTTWGSRNDNFDGIFDTRTSFWDALGAVLRCGRTAPLLAGASLSFVRDEAKSVYRTAFSPRNMLPSSFAIDYQMYDAAAADAVIVEFVDYRTWSSNQIFCALPDSTVDPDDPAVPRLQWLGITDRDHAWREGIHLAAASRYRRAFPSFRTELDGRLCFKGDLVKVSHWLPIWGASMEVLALTQDAGGDILTLSEPWSVPAGHDADTKLIMLTTPDGKPYGPVQFALLDSGGSARQASVRLLTSADPGGRYAGQIPRAWPVWSGDGRQYERPQAVLGVASIMARDCLIVSMKPERGMTATVTCVLDDSRVYDADTGGVPTETDPPAGAADADLTITNVLLKRVSQDSGGEQVYAMVAGAPDAVSFSAHWKWAGVADYGDEMVGLPRIFIFASEAQALSFQVRAHGGSAIGPWFDATLAAGNAASGVVATVDTLPTTGNVEGRVVYLTADGKLYRYHSAAWTAAVPALDITDYIATTQIADNAITTPKLSANAVTANKMFIGTSTGAALNADPGCQDPSAWIADAGSIFGGYDSGVQAWKFGSLANTETHFHGAKGVQVDINKKYRIRARVYRSGANGTFYLQYADMTDTETVTGTNAIGAQALTPTNGTWVVVSSSVFSPGTGRIAPYIRANVSGSAGNYYLTDIRLEEVIPGELIVDGAIKANHLDANSVTAGKLDVGAIDAGNIIANNIVVTGHLVADAATIHGKEDFSGITSVNDTSYHDLSSSGVVKTFTGSEVEIDFLVVVNNSDNGDHSVAFRLLKDGSSIKDFPATAGQGFTVPHTGNLACAFAWHNTPSAGSHTYKLQWRNPSAGTTTLTAEGTLRADEIKR